MAPAAVLRAAGIAAARLYRATTSPPSSRGDAELHNNPTFAAAVSTRAIDNQSLIIETSSASRCVQPSISHRFSPPSCSPHDEPVQSRSSRPWTRVLHKATAALLLLLLLLSLICDLCSCFPASSLPTFRALHVHSYLLESVHNAGPPCVNCLKLCRWGRSRTCSPTCSPSTRRIYIVRLPHRAFPTSASTPTPLDLGVLTMLGLGLHVARAFSTSAT